MGRKKSCHTVDSFEVFSPFPVITKGEREGETGRGKLEGGKGRGKREVDKMKGVKRGK